MQVVEGKGDGNSQTTLLVICTISAAPRSSLHVEDATDGLPALCKELDCLRLRCRA